MNTNHEAIPTPVLLPAVQQGPPLALMPFARLVATLAIVMGVTVLIGWWLSKPVLITLAGPAVMKPNTALCFLLTGLSLGGLVAASRQATGGALTHFMLRVQPFAAGLLLIIAGITVLTHWMQWPSGIDKLLVPGAEPINRTMIDPWRMSPVTASSFTLIAITMLPWPARLKWWWVGMELVVLLTSVVAFIMTLGYVFDARSLYSVPGFSSVALHTALGLLVLTKAELTVHPRFLLAGQIMAPDQAGQEMRRLLPAAILLPCIVGWLLLTGLRGATFDLGFGVAVFSAATMLIFSTLVWWNSQAVRRGEQRRKDLEGRLADVLNSATDAIITIDEDLRIRLFNRAAEEIFRRKSRDVLGEPLDMLLPERQRKTHSQQVLRYSRMAPEMRSMGILGNIHGLRANGEEFPIEASISHVDSGGQKLLTVILRDVTERIRTEEALRAYLRRVEALAELDRAILGVRSTHEIAETALHHLRRMITCTSASVVMFAKDGNSQRILARSSDPGSRYTPVAHPIFTYEHAQLGQSNHGQAILIDDLRTTESGVELFRHLRKAGAVSYAGLPLRGEHRLLGMLELVDEQPDRFTQDQLQAARTIGDQLAIALQQAMLRDDIERHAAGLEVRVRERTRELEETNQQLTAANRDLEEFTASAAHDLRAPLNAMAGNCKLLSETVRKHPEEDARHRMERISGAVQRMNDVIDGMLGLAKLTKVELERATVDLGAVAEDVVQELRQQYPSHDVHFKISCGEAVVADTRLMRSLLMNLIGNAWKYTTTTSAPAVEILRSRNEPIPTFVVRDNGVGFDMNYAQHLFEPFRRMHTVSEFPGVGIGLATAARIVQRYGGKIWAESAVGKGAAFHFTLPQAVADEGDERTG